MSCRRSRKVGMARTEVDSSRSKTGVEVRFLGQCRRIETCDRNDSCLRITDRPRLAPIEIVGQRFLGRFSKGLDMAQHEGSAIRQVDGAVAVQGADVGGLAFPDSKPGCPDQDSASIVLGKTPTVHNDER